MVYSREQIEQGLAIYGDTLYRVALLIAGDERRAARLLRDLAATMAAARPTPDAPPPPLDEPVLLTMLAAAARAAEERPTNAAPRPEGRSRVNLFAPFALHHLSLEQRLAVGLHLLLGYDGPRLASVLGGDVPAAHAALVGAVRALGPAAGAALTDRVGGEQCASVRSILIDPAAGSRHGAAVRGHLAGCSHCRAFDHAWGLILAAVEEALRTALRSQVMPVPLRARIVALAMPRVARHAPSWQSMRLALAPLAVIAVIAALALPGFLRQPVRVVDEQPGPPVDAQALITRALERHATPPEQSGIWHARYETLWYFSDGVYAPLRAEIWLDPRNPARHRLQLTHRDGGAPYELQIGDGTARLAYALDAAYAPTMYGGLPSPARVEQPALVNQTLSTAGQVRARDERLSVGPWSLPPAYLRQARAAGDLRLLGRQLDGGRLVQILSFSGVSPLGLPPDAPGATAERITVLLALDREDGLLRSATELSGPPGGAQVGRVTWRLVDEQWFTAFDQIDAAFAIERAWTGIGRFDDEARPSGADAALPLLDARAVGDPAALLTRWRLPIWMPTRPPAGVERALLLWDARAQRSDDPPAGLIYLGPGRRMVLAFNRSQVVAGEQLAVGPWRVSLQAGRGQRYTASAVRAVAGREQGRLGLFDPSATLLLDAYGFTRAEIEHVIESIAPLDLGTLSSHESLLVRTDASDPAARAALLEAVTDLTDQPAQGVAYLRTRAYLRQNPTLSDARRDPYHLSYYEGRPQVTRLEEWLLGEGTALGVYGETRDPADGAILVSRYADTEQYWDYLPAGEALTEAPEAFVVASARLPAAARLAVGLLGDPGTLTLQRQLGGVLVRHSEQAVTSRRYGMGISEQFNLFEPYLFDLRPMTLTTEIDLSPSDELLAVRVYAERLDGNRLNRTLVQSYELVERATVPLSEAPAPVRDGLPPSALVTVSFSAEPLPRAEIVSHAAVDQVAGWPDVPLYIVDPAAATLLGVEEGGAAGQGPSLDYGAVGDSLQEAVARGLAVRLVYRTPAGEATPASFDLRIVQGPAGPLRTFLRGSAMAPWAASRPIRLTVAGQDVDAWYGSGDRTYLFVELGETLLVIDAARPPDDPGLRTLLAGLRPA